MCRDKRAKVLPLPSQDSNINGYNLHPIVINPKAHEGGLFEEKGRRPPFWSPHLLRAFKSKVKHPSEPLKVRHSSQGRARRWACRPHYQSQPTALPYCKRPWQSNRGQPLL